MNTSGHIKALRPASLFRHVKRAVVVTTAAAIALTAFGAIPAHATTPTIQGFAHVQNIGDMRPSAANPLALGTTGRSLRVEGMTLALKGAPAGSGIKYQVHIQNEGWQSWRSNGAFAGSRAKSQRLEGFYAYLTGPVADQYTLQYRAHVQNIGWQPWKDGGSGAVSFAGTQGRSLRMEQLDFRLVKKTSTKPPAAAIKNAVESEAARFGMKVVWRSLGGIAGQYPSGGNIMEIDPNTTAMDRADHARSLVRHEAAHHAIYQKCRKIFPQISGSRGENVTDAWAVLYHGGLSYLGYGYNSSDTAIAKKIKGGQCLTDAQIAKDAAEKKAADAAAAALKQRQASIKVGSKVKPAPSSSYATSTRGTVLEVRADGKLVVQQTGSSVRLIGARSDWDLA